MEYRISMNNLFLSFIEIKTGNVSAIFTTNENDALLIDDATKADNIITLICSSKEDHSILLYAEKIEEEVAENGRN